MKTYFKISCPILYLSTIINYKLSFMTWLMYIVSRFKCALRPVRIYVILSKSVFMQIWNCLWSLLNAHGKKPRNFVRGRNHFLLSEDVSFALTFPENEISCNYNFMKAWITTVVLLRFFNLQNLLHCEKYVAFLLWCDDVIHGCCHTLATKGP